LAHDADVVIAARGPKITVFQMKKDPPDEATLLKHILGPTGNLRAPTTRRGRTLFIGFHPQEFAKFLE
jgi:hypothetical protein